MAKKRNKKYNPQKTTNSLVKASIKNSGIIFVTGGRGAHIVNLETNNQYAPSSLVARALGQLVANWTVLCAVLLKDSNGKEYASYYLDHWNINRRQSQIAEEAEAVHQKLLKTCQKNHLVNLGWIAVPELYEFTHDQANEMFLKAGAWDDYAEWEKVNNVHHDEVQTLQG